MILNRFSATTIVSTICLILFTTYIGAFVWWHIKHEAGLFDHDNSHVMPVLDNVLFNNSLAVNSDIAKKIQECGMREPATIRLACLGLGYDSNLSNCPGKWLLQRCVHIIVPDYILFSEFGPSLISAVRAPCRYLTGNAIQFHALGCQNNLNSRPYRWSIVSNETRVRIGE